MFINKIEEELNSFDSSYNGIMKLLKSNDGLGTKPTYIMNYYGEQVVVFSEKVDIDQFGTNKIQIICFDKWWKFKDRLEIVYDPSFLDKDNFPTYFEDYALTSKKIVNYFSDIISGSTAQEKFQAVYETKKRFEEVFYKRKYIHELHQIKIQLFNITWKTLEEKHPYFFDCFDQWLTLQQDPPRRELTRPIKLELNYEICEKIASFKINTKEFITLHEGGSKGEILYKLLTNELTINESKKLKLYCNAWPNHSVYYLLTELERITTLKIFPRAIDHLNILILSNDKFLKSGEIYKARTRKRMDYENIYPEIAKQINEQLDALTIR